ncbi:short-chain dehydrogenase [Colletotrichum scovillei]|uniref:Short-chain dehydrogenase n=1 Tax=Colletotrichum scovillei TaxID=1209932 RepID=A0A9P7R9E2_9PEZI|nr:short-chain dehydrogenase [Colletotrichum scovillei]KAF4777233.1 short-chain dehydrogenase [Colletotrichum scovillei]KAG7053325.1 short-chain dehydrogenase [Colletotrichum scovillei]KAG7071618.1 short-chain dehydrogenase [Colletotrichum scovillei]KAG7079869.1 short-chain dehydrogenase [Colletotrichum scovillei]
MTINPIKMSGALLPLRARHCLITGAYGGIGAAIASRFAAEGALVTLLGRKENKLRDLCAQLPPFRDHRLAPLTSSASASASPSPSEAKPTHSYAVMDVSADARDEAVLDDIWKRTGQIDVLVNAAGIAQFQLLQNTSPQAARELIDTNLMGTIFMSRYMAQRMKRRRADRDACIINVASLLAEKGSPGTSVYAASKAGIIGLTHALSVELGPLRIRTNAIVPGYIETNMLAAMSREPLEKRIPLGRLGRPDEVADAAVFLAQNTYANNCILNLDGGLSAV